MMRKLRAVTVRLGGLFGAARREREWNAEFQAHLEMHTEDNVRAGMSPEEARRRALADFGGVESVKEWMRDLSTLVWLDTAWRDLRYALWSLRRSPGFTIAALLSLTLGLGASLSVFTVADNLLVRPLPYRDPSRLVMVWEADRKGGNDHNVASPANYLDWKSQNDVLEGIAALTPDRSVLTDRGRAEEFRAASVTVDLFKLLGVRPFRGRLFTPMEGRSSTVLLISYRLWQSWFAGDEHIIGRKVRANSVSATVIGVLPPNFHFLDRQTDLWWPLDLDPAKNYRETSGRWLYAVARLRPGVGIWQAQAHMAVLAKRLEKAYPAFNTNWGVNIEPLRDALSREAKTPVLVLLAAVILLLAVGCVNVANLLLARYSSRTREIAVRASLGAGRWRVAGQLLTESTVLGVAGGICGLILARWMVSGLLALAPKDLAQSSEIHVDLRILVVAIAISLLTGILFGLAPALVTSRIDLTGALRGDRRSGLGAGSRLRSWLIGAEVAVSVVLLTCAILLSRSLLELEGVNSGIDPSNVLTFRVSLLDSSYEQAGARTAFLKRALDAISHLPGVRSASAAGCIPFTGGCYVTDAKIEGRSPAKPGEGLTAAIQIVMPGYFRTLGIPLSRGRGFTETDNTSSSPVRFMVNEAFVKQYLPGEQPLGKRISALIPDFHFHDLLDNFQA